MLNKHKGKKESQVFKGVFSVLKKVSLVVLIALIMLLTGAGSALARSSYKADFNAKYGTAGTRLDTCNICHGSNTGYYDDFSSSGNNFTAIEQKDSDGDGIDNITEIKALTFPNDPNDKPAATPPVNNTPPVDNTPTVEETAPPAPPAPDTTLTPPVLDTTPTPVDEVTPTPILDITPTPPNTEAAADVQVSFGKVKQVRNRIFGFIIVQNTGSEAASVPVTLSDGTDTIKTRAYTIEAGKSIKLRFRYLIRDSKAEALTLTTTALLESDPTPENNTATETISTTADYKNLRHLDLSSKDNKSDDKDAKSDKDDEKVATNRSCGQD